MCGKEQAALPTAVGVGDDDDDDGFGDGGAIELSSVRLDLKCIACSFSNCCCFVIDAYQTRYVRMLYDAKASL